MMEFIKGNPIKLIILSLLLGFVTYRIATAEPKGFCSGKAFNGKTGVYLTDEEFIFAALKILSWADTPRGVYTEDGKTVVKPTDELIKNYIKKHPNCCLVDREGGGGLNTNQGLLNRALKMKQFVIVAYQDFEGVKKNPVFIGYDDNSLGLNTCGGTYNWQFQIKGCKDMGMNWNSLSMDDTTMLFLYGSYSVPADLTDGLRIRSGSYETNAQGQPA